MIFSGSAFKQVKQHLHRCFFLLPLQRNRWRSPRSFCQMDPWPSASLRERALDEERCSFVDIFCIWRSGSRKYSITNQTFCSFVPFGSFWVSQTQNSELNWSTCKVDSYLLFGLKMFWRGFCCWIFLLALVCMISHLRMQFFPCDKNCKQRVEVTPQKFRTRTLHLGP